MRLLNASKHAQLSLKSDLNWECGVLKFSICKHNIALKMFI